MMSSSSSERFRQREVSHGKYHGDAESTNQPVRHLIDIEIRIVPTSARQCDGYRRGQNERQGALRDPAHEVRHDAEASQLRQTETRGHRPGRYSRAIEGGSAGRCVFIWIGYERILQYLSPAREYHRERE